MSMRNAEKPLEHNFFMRFYFVIVDDTVVDVVAFSVLRI